MAAPAFDRAALLDVLERRLSESSRSRPLAAPGRGLSQREQLDLDLTRIFGGHRFRSYGAMPAVLGGFERVCPGSQMYNALLKLRQRRSVR